MSPPHPPTHHFHTVRTLSSTESGAATYLCLPRRLAHNPTPSTHPKTHNLALVLKNAPYALLKRETDYAYAAQLIVVKMHVDTTALRRESNLLTYLHSNGGTELSVVGGGSTQSFLGSYIIGQQFTGDPASSWICLRPYFGRPLHEWGRYSVSRTCVNPRTGMEKPIDAFFVWHIFLSLVETLSYLHERNGVVNNRVVLENVVLNPYPVHGLHWFRNWPDVVVVDFGAATWLDESRERDEVRALLDLICHVVMKYSDAALLRERGCSVEMSPLFQFVNDVNKFFDEAEDQEMKIATVKARWGAMATEQRGYGPKIFPEDHLRLAKSELVDADGLARGRAIVLNKFGGTLEKFRAFARARRERWPVVYTEVQATNRRTKAKSGLCIIKFRQKKAYLLRDMGKLKRYLEERYGYGYARKVDDLKIDLGESIDEV
jgi:serine/threonine protein kinase